MDSLIFNFWSVVVDVNVPSEADYNHFCYYFQDFVVTRQDTEPAWWIRLTAPSDPFCVRSSPDQVVSFSCDSRKWVNYRPFACARPTPLPPFSLPPLNRLLRTLHASAICPPEAPERALLLHGASLSGKSSLLLELLRRGWFFIADDTVPIYGNDQLLRYSRPIGVRAATLARNPWLAPYVNSGPRFRTPTGITSAVHVRDLPVRVAQRSTTWTWTAVLYPGSNLSVTRCGPTTINAKFDVAKGVNDLADVIHEFVIQEGG